MSRKRSIAASKPAASRGSVIGRCRIIVPAATDHHQDQQHDAGLDGTQSLPDLRAEGARIRSHVSSLHLFAMHVAARERSEKLLRSLLEKLRAVVPRWMVQIRHKTKRGTRIFTQPVHRIACAVSHLRVSHALPGKAFALWNVPLREMQPFHFNLGTRQTPSFRPQLTCAFSPMAVWEKAQLGRSIGNRSPSAGSADSNVLFQQVKSLVEKRNRRILRRASCIITRDGMVKVLGGSAKPRFQTAVGRSPQDPAALACCGDSPRVVPSFGGTHPVPLEKNMDRPSAWSATKIRPKAKQSTPRSRPDA